MMFADFPSGPAALSSSPQIQTAAVAVATREASSGVLRPASETAENVAPGREQNGPAGGATWQRTGHQVSPLGEAEGEK